MQLADELPAWADLVFVTEKRLLRMLRERFPDSAAEVICLAVSDDFQFQQAELVAPLAGKLTPHPGLPA